MATWRVARTLDVLLAEINASAPKRSKTADGSIGDAAHAVRSSDHNPWFTYDGRGIVTARDFTHDPAGGFDSYAFAEWLLRQQSPRLKYVISRGRIGSGPGGKSPGRWRAYDGPNAHAHHVHVSVVALPDLFDADGGWGWQAFDLGDRILSEGDEGEDVEQLQKLLRTYVPALPVDGDYGPLTTKAVKVVQARLLPGAKPDGDVGPITLAALKAALTPAPPSPFRPLPAAPAQPTPTAPTLAQEADVLHFVWNSGHYLVVAGKIVPLEDVKHIPTGTPSMGTLSDRQHQLLVEALAGAAA